MFEGKVSDVLMHPNLFTAYPHLADVRVMYEASVNADNEPYYGAWSDFNSNEIVLGNGLTEDQLKSGLLHELQHFVQQSEGFAGGANTTDANYKNIAGEVEARNVQSRQHFTAEERRNISPESTEDVAREFQSVRFNNERNDFALIEDSNSDFAKAVDEVAGGGEPKSSVIKLGTTPDVLKMIGIDNANVVMAVRTIRKDMFNKHGVSAEAMKQLPKQMNNPVAVMRSQSDSSNPNAYLMLTELVEVERGKRKPIVATLSFEKNQKGELELINVASAYGRRPNQINRDLGNVLYWNKSKGEHLINNFSLLETAETASLRTLLLSSDRLSISDIKTEADLSQYLSAKNQPQAIDTQKFKQIVTKAVGESAVENIDVIQRGAMPDGAKRLITADVEGWFDPKSGKITLVADGIQATPTMTREERIAWVAWHELAHRGVNVRLKGEYKSVMHRADSHSVINAVATAIQQDRLAQQDPAANNRSIAVEEAIAEVFSAYQTGNLNELESRYGVKVSQLQRKRFKTWLERFADKVRALIDKLFGTETADKFSNDDLVMLMTEIKKGIEGESAVKNQNVLFSTQSKSDSFKATEAKYGGEKAYNQAKPDGKTELDYHQWVQVRTPEFKAWFGDWENDPKNASKVINKETGEPLVVYHGTGNKFNVFEKMKSSRGNFFTGESREVEPQAFFFSEDYDYSEQVARVRANETIEVKSVFLNMRYRNNISDYADISDYTTDTEEDFMDKSIWTYFDDREFTDKLKEDYDGVVFEEDSGELTYAVFSSNQIKSATDNNGNFDPNNNDIRYSLNESADSDFAKAVDEIAQGKSVARYVSVGTTPNVLKMIGLPDVRVTISGEVLHKVTQGKHNVATETLKQLPSQINNPVAVMKSETRPNGYVVLTELIEQTNGKDKPVIAALHLKHSKQGLELISIASVYGRSNSQIQRGLNNDLLYWNTAKGSQFLTAFGLQLPSHMQSITNLSTSDIKTEADLSQYLSENSDTDIRFSRSSQSALDLAKTGKVKGEKTFWEELTTLDGKALKERFDELAGKLDENFADSLRPVNDWIDKMQFSNHTSTTNGRDHEKRRLKDAMYTAKGKRDALNSDLEHRFLKPILKEIASIAKKTKGRNERDIKAMVGTWLSTRYSIDKNMEFLQADEKAMLEAKQKLDELKIRGASNDEIHQAGLAYRKAEHQYLGRKADVESRDFSDKRKYQVGAAGGWSIPLAREIMNEIEAKIPKAKLEAIGDLVADLNQARLEIDRESGRYTEEEYQRYRQNRRYVPLTGDPNAEEGFDFIAGAGGNSLNIGRDRAANGRTGSEADDAITTIWEATGKSTTYSGWSEFKNKIDDLFETEVNLLKEQGYSKAEARFQAEENLGIGKRRMQGLTRTNDDVLIAKHGGVYYEYSLPKQVMNALKADNVENANAFLRAISKPTSWYARGVTQWTATFAPINMIRDTWEKSEFIRVQKVYGADGKLLDSKTMDKIGRTLIANAVSPSTWAATKRFGFEQELRNRL